ncbi:MAG: exodeoxyribonuclease V subunit alpha [Deltaproteobacteria bacterium]|nr:exodeoxyribonuclease V subunit alpha [Deltaproteobacteria bacterium]
MTMRLEELRERGVLADLDVHLAHTLARLVDERRPEVALAVALASRAVGEGHVCLDLERVAAPGGLVDDGGAAVDTGGWPAPQAWCAMLAESRLVGERETPLVLSAQRLYLRRYWRYEERVAAAIAARVAADDGAVDAARLRDGLRRLFPSTSATPDWQRVAAFAAVRRRFCVISGGPGTGKTHTVVRILALLIEQALASGRPLPRVALLAPTGKAAARLGEAIRAGVASLDCVAAVRSAIQLDAATIHRCLGALPGRSAAFRHHRGNRLRIDVALVDEASMVDLALMAHLTDALPEEARLILLGDRDQLASVEAGAVLGDICNSGVARLPSAAFAAAVRAACGDVIAADPASPAPAASQLSLWSAPAPATAAPIADSIVVLTHSYRYDAAGGIGRVARAVNAGDAAELFDACAAGGAVRWREPAGDAIDAELAEEVVRGFAAFARAATPLARLRALETFRVLCAHRRGPFGVETVNAQIEQLLAARGWLQPDAVEYPGRPILVTRNDYGLGLFNGDVGVIDRAAEAAADPLAAARVAYFPDGQGGVRPIAVARLPEHETVFALSVHKSQGSEFDQVALLLPRRVSPIVSRELLYTAVTRARHAVLLVATREVVERAVATPVERASGLCRRLWGA